MLALTDMACAVLAIWLLAGAGIDRVLAALATICLVVGCRLEWGRPIASSLRLTSIAARDIGLALAASALSLVVSGVLGGAPRDPWISAVLAGALLSAASRVCLLALAAWGEAWLIERVVVLGRDHVVSRWIRAAPQDGLRVVHAGAVLLGDGPCPVALIDRIGSGSDGWAGRTMDDSAVRLLRRVDRFLLLHAELTDLEADAALGWLDGVSQEVHLLADASQSPGDTPARPSSLRPAAMQPGGLVAKRTLDVVLAGSAVLLLLPALLLIGVLIRLESRGPALFRQTRAGCDNLPFTVLKFRTMGVDGVASDGSVQAVRGDARVTRLGRILRRTSIDELPQLLNVIGGSMSLVGPRPHPIALNRRFEPLIAHYASRHSVPPGITGWAQVNGARGETATLDLMRRRVELDLEYVSRRSIAMDLWILVRTVGSVVADRDVY